jgi:hypothetical protein
MSPFVFFFRFFLFSFFWFFRFFLFNCISHLFFSLLIFPRVDSIEHGALITNSKAPTRAKLRKDREEK